MLGTGLIIYMLSKELYVINHETFAAASIGAVIIYGVKKFGPSVAAFADKLNEVGWRHGSFFNLLSNVAWSVDAYPFCLVVFLFFIDREHCARFSLLCTTFPITLIYFSTFLLSSGKSGQGSGGEGHRHVQPVSGHREWEQGTVESRGKIGALWRQESKQHQPFISQLLYSSTFTAAYSS